MEIMINTILGDFNDDYILAIIDNCPDSAYRYILLLDKHLRRNNTNENCTDVKPFRQFYHQGYPILKEKLNKNYLKEKFCLSEENINKLYDLLTKTFIDFDKGNLYLQNKKPEETVPLSAYIFLDKIAKELKKYKEQWDVSGFIEKLTKNAEQEETYNFILDLFCLARVFGESKFINWMHGKGTLNNENKEIFNTFRHWCSIIEDTVKEKIQLVEKIDKKIDETTKIR